MKKILITGAAGFIGYHLSEKLSADNELTLIDNFTRNKMDPHFEKLIQKENISFINADLTNKDFYIKLESFYDEIIHLAAINGTKYFYEKPYEVLRVNLLSLMNTLEWINEDNCGRFLFSSSSEAYAGTISLFSNSHDFLPSKEDIPLSIDNIFNERYSYGGSKLAGELLTSNYFKFQNMPYYIVRFHNIYGPRMGFEHVIPEFAKRVFNKENPFKIFGGNQTRAFCFIDDATSAIEGLINHESQDREVFHIGNPNEEINIIELAKRIFLLSKYEPKIEIKKPPQGSVERRCPDTSKIEDYINYSPKINLSDGLEKTLNWYYEYFSTK